jgi:hypothetical protein
MVQLGLREMSVTADAPAIERARASFEREHAIRLPRLLDSACLAFVRPQMEIEGFRERVHDALPSRPTDLVLNRGLVSGLLAMLTNDPCLLAFVRRLTGQDAIQSFSGDVHRREPGANHEDAWHSDMVDRRVAALTINLGAEPFDGGVLQIREAPDGPIVYEYKNDGDGDAILFKLDRRLKHRVTTPAGRVARTVYAGWFRAEPVRRVMRLET